MATDNHVIVRTYSAGVYAGILREESPDGKRVTLDAARLIHSWEGALTTLDLAHTGPTKAKTSHPTDGTRLTEVVATVRMTDAAIRRFAEIPPWKP